MNKEYRKMIKDMLLGFVCLSKDYNDKKLTYNAFCNKYVQYLNTVLLDNAEKQGFVETSNFPAIKFTKKGLELLGEEDNEQN